MQLREYISSQIGRPKQPNRKTFFGASVKNVLSGCYFFNNFFSRQYFLLIFSLFGLIICSLQCKNSLSCHNHIPLKKQNSIETCRPNIEELVDIIQQHLLK